MSMKNPSFELSEYLYLTTRIHFEDAEKLNEKLPPVIDITYLHVLLRRVRLDIRNAFQQRNHVPIFA